MFAKAGQGESFSGLSFACDAARHADLDLDLITYCEREKIPFVEFNDFSQILATVKSIVEGKTAVEAVHQ